MSLETDICESQLAVESLPRANMPIVAVWAVYVILLLELAFIMAGVIIPFVL